MSQGDSEFIFDARLALIVISNTANVGGMNTSRSPAPTPAPVNDLSQRGQFPGRLGTVLRVALAVVVMAAGVLVLLPLVPFGVLGKADSMAGVAIETVAMSGSSLFVLLLTWLVVTRLDGRPLSDLRLRVDRRAMVWMLAMMVVAVANVVIVGAVMNLLGIESTAERIKDLPLPIVGALVLHQVNLAFLLQGFPEELVWRGWLVRSLGDGRIAGITSVIGFTLIHLISKGGQEGWIERILYLATPFGFAVAAVVVLWVSDSTWAAVGVHAGSHMANLVLFVMPVDRTHPVAWVLEGALWLVVAGVVWFLARRRALIASH